MAEINLELAAGDTMAAKFASDGGTLKWNVHSHEGDKAGSAKVHSTHPAE